jgi:hypothetical protein
MARGGRRPGAGRKRGSKNRAVIAREQAAREAAEAGMTPLQRALSIMRNPRAKEKRRDFAMALAMPYCHAKLMAIEGNPDKPIVVETRMDEMQLARAVAYILWKATNPQASGRTFEHPQKKVTA